MTKEKAKMINLSEEHLKINVANNGIGNKVLDVSMNMIASLLDDDRRFIVNGKHIRRLNYPTTEIVRNSEVRVFHNDNTWSIFTSAYCMRSGSNQDIVHGALTLRFFQTEKDYKDNLSIRSYPLHDVKHIVIGYSNIGMFSGAKELLASKKPFPKLTGGKIDLTREVLEAALPSSVTTPKEYITRLRLGKEYNEELVAIIQEMQQVRSERKELEKRIIALDKELGSTKQLQRELSQLRRVTK